MVHPLERQLYIGDSEYSTIKFEKLILNLQEHVDVGLNMPQGTISILRLLSPYSFTVLIRLVNATISS